MIREAAERLYNKKEITAEEYEIVKEAADDLEKLSALSFDTLQELIGESAKRGGEVISSAAKKIGQIGPAIGKTGKGLELMAKLIGGAGALVLAGEKALKLKPVQSAIKKALPPLAKAIYPKQNIIAQHWSKVKPVGIGLAAGTAGLFGVKELAESAANPFQAATSFSKIKKHTPMLEQYDDQQLKDYFNVVKTFSPRAAENPLVAGALVHKMIEFGGVDHKLVQDIADIEAKRPESIIRDIARSGIKAVTHGRIEEE